MFSPSIQKLIDIFVKFPTVGPRTAARFIFYLIKLPQEEFKNLLDSLKNLKETIRICSFCFNPFEPAYNASHSNAGGGSDSLCPICENPSRDKTLLCIIEKETDLISIEKTKKYRGLYFILGDLLSALKNEDDKKIRIKELEKRIKNPEKFGIPRVEFQEIIIALNPTTEGEATALYLERKLKNLTGVKITRLGKGLPVGGELEYADEETLRSAFEGRK